MRNGNQDLTSNETELEQGLKSHESAHIALTWPLKQTPLHTVGMKPQLSTPTGLSTRIHIVVTWHMDKHECTLRQTSIHIFRTRHAKGLRLWTCAYTPATRIPHAHAADCADRT